MTRARGILLIVLFSSLAAAGALTYKRWPQLFHPASPQQTPSPSSRDELLSIPPFSTKEPERYQATRVITNVEEKNGTAVTLSNKTIIARDGARRREEYADETSNSVVYMETPEGRFVLLPAKKLYADLSLTTSDSGSENPSTDAPDFSPESLLHETPAEARYEKLGPETINERATTRYRVTSTGPASVTLIWIDDALGIPIRSETSTPEGDHKMKMVVELRNLKQTIDPGVFELPKDYRKVNYDQLLGEQAKPPVAQSGERSGSAKP